MDDAAIRRRMLSELKRLVEELEFRQQPSNMVLEETVREVVRDDMRMEEREALLRAEREAPTQQYCIRVRGEDGKLRYACWTGSDGVWSLWDAHAVASMWPTKEAANAALEGAPPGIKYTGFVETYGG